MGAFSEDFGAWLSAARGGSREALGRALQACQRYLLGIAQRELDVNLQGKGGASDLVQETFVVAQRAFGRFHGNSEAELRAWLRRLLHDRAAKFGRRYRAAQKRRVVRETALTASNLPTDEAAGAHSPLPSPSVQVMAREQADRLRQALERLPDDYRNVLTLRYVEQYSFEEIGRRMQRTPNAARLLWLRAVQRVKEELRPPDEP
jgi:RNA polymerase sigma-70 factor, ECF subfamily